MTTNEIEIRGKEMKVSKTGNEYIIVRVEDETGVTQEFCDKNINNFERYKKGKACRLVMDITINKQFTNINIFKILDQEEV